jgi:ribosomal protein S18 acetylase RimI-like enzyme
MDDVGHQKGRKARLLMDEDGGTGAIPLIDTSSERVIGKVSLDLCDEEHQIVIQRIKPKEPDAPVSLLSEALKRVLDDCFARDYKSAIAWPPSTDQTTSSILEAAGFTRTGLFMRRPTFNENGQIAFRPLCASELGSYLDKQARRKAEQAAERTHCDQKKAYLEVRQEYAERFAGGAISDDEAIMEICDASTGDSVGLLWTVVAQQGPDLAAFVEEFEIHESERGKGCGTKTIRAIGNASFGRPVTVVSLFVQPENEPAYGLYKKLGFTPGRYEYAYWRRCAQQPLSPAVDNTKSPL